MTLQPLLESTFAIQLHTMSAILAFVLGGLVLFRRKGDALHRHGGRIWVALMAVVCLSSFFIHTVQMVGIWSPIHLLSVATMVALFFGVRSAWMHRITDHQKIMQSTYFGALILAGYFTFMPGRIMYRMVFGGLETTPVPLVAAILAGMAVIYFWTRLAFSSRSQYPAQRQN